MKTFKPWREYLENVLVAILLALIVRTFVMTGYKVPTSSMAPTLIPGDFVFSFKLPYGVKIPLTDKKIASGRPQRGELVVFSYPEQPRVYFVKRVVGLPGDHIQIAHGQLVINGEKATYQNLGADYLPLFPGRAGLEARKEEILGSERVLFFTKDSQSKSYGPMIVPPNEVFLLGDNRDASDDSRYWGTVPVSKIEGRLFLIWLSLDWQNRALGGVLPGVRSERIFTSLH
ncbi:MAG: signal peptidase I [Proteobacteria bacterium]|jgi:signal peptidase I|nr:signal peptidase I [Pseudomonadota bacterium]